MIHQNLQSISHSYKGILLDAYGVFWGGNQKGFLPGAKEAISQLAKAGKIIGILSNTTQLSQNEINKLHDHDLKIGIDYHFLITSGQVAFNLFSEENLPFSTPKKRYYLLGDAHPCFSSHQNLFVGSPYIETKNIQEADFIYISIPHINGVDQTTIDVFEEQIKDLKNLKLPAVCTNPDLFAHEGAPPKLVVRQGSIAALLEKNGVTVFYIGKPSLIMFEKALAEFDKYESFEKNSIIMIGDTPETDIRGGNAFGFHTALVTTTGLFFERTKNKDIKIFIDQLSQNDSPNYFLKHL